MIRKSIAHCSDLIVISMGMIKFSIIFETLFFMFTSSSPQLGLDGKEKDDPGKVKEENPEFVKDASASYEDNDGYVIPSLTGEHREGGYDQFY
jgi:hypothetical protein